MIGSIKLTTLATDGSTLKHSPKKINEIISHLEESRLSWLEFVVDDVPSDAIEVAKELGIDLNPTSVLAGYYSNYEDSGDVLGVSFPLIRFASGQVDPSPILIYVSRNNVVTIHDKSVEMLLHLSSFSDVFLRKLPSQEGEWADRQSILFTRIIDEISEKNYDALRLIVEKAQTLEIELIDEKMVTKDITNEMSKIKRSILTFLTAVWAAHTTVHSLRYGDPEMLTDKPELLSKFDIVLADLDRQIQLAEHVLEVLSTGMNVIQTDISNRLSMIILWLSVIGTAVLVPNTLATIFAIIPNSNELFTELMIAIIFSTIAASFVSYFAASKIMKRPMRKDDVSDNSESN